MMKLMAFDAGKLRWYVPAVVEPILDWLNDENGRPVAVTTSGRYTYYEDLAVALADFVWLRDDETDEFDVPIAVVPR